MRNQQDILSDVFLQPWFMSQPIAFAIRSMIPVEHRHKMRLYFDDYGCLKCEKKQVQYGSNAMCKPCVQSVKLKMLFAIKRKWEASNLTQTAPRSFQRAAVARRLLADLKAK